MVYKIFCKFRLSVFFILIFFAQESFPKTIEEIKELYAKRQYFDLREKLREFQNDRHYELNFYRGAVANKFNSPKQSIKLLNIFLKNAPRQNQLLRNSYAILADNYTKNYNYGKAGEIYRKILQDFSSELSANEKANYENVAKLWSALSKIPPQKIRFNGDSKIQGVQELVGLTVPLGFNGQTEFFIFDTGANLSTVSESFAQKLKLQIIETQIDVGSISGAKIKAKLGVAKRIKIGNTTAENVIFIIFPDKALYVEPIKFQINGILGFPVIEALREITWSKNKEIFITANPTKKTTQNLALDGLTPLIEGTYKNKKMAFAFDTGASNTSLYPMFFKAFEKEITENGEQISEKITGVGGTKEIKAFRLKELIINFGGKDAKLVNTEVLTEKTSGSSEFFYGNIGRDVINQFEKMTLNFQTMSVFFE